MICKCGGEISEEKVGMEFGDPAFGSCAKSIASARLCAKCGKAHYQNGEPVIVVQQSEVFRTNGETKFVEIGTKYPVFVPAETPAT